MAANLRSYLGRRHIIIIWVVSVLLSCCSCQHHVVHSTEHLKGFTGISDFKILNRRVLLECPDPNPYLQINISSSSGTTLSDEEYVTVNVTGVLVPADSDWVGMISPSDSE